LEKLELARALLSIFFTMPTDLSILICHLKKNYVLDNHISLKSVTRRSKNVKCGRYHFYDTPGFADTEGEDVEILEEIMKLMNKVTMHFIILVISVERMDVLNKSVWEYLINFLQEFIARDRLGILITKIDSIEEDRFEIEFTNLKSQVERLKK